LTDLGRYGALFLVDKTRDYGVGLRVKGRWVMKDKERIVLLQKQVSIAIKALKDIRDNGISWTVAETALEEIESIRFVKEQRID